MSYSSRLSSPSLPPVPGAAGRTRAAARVVFAAAAPPSDVAIAARPARGAACRMESLEPRRLMSLAATTPWGANPSLIRQDLQTAQFPLITGKNQAIAILDTGIDYTHPLLGSGGFGTGHKVVGGYDFVDDDDDPMDTFGHGTAVAGVIGAKEFKHDGRRYRGVAPDADLIALRVDAANDEVPNSRIEAALEWVLAHRVEFNIVAVNISFGSGHVAGTHTSPYSDELALLKSRGVFVAAASGNSGVSEPYGVQYPAADKSVFAVGAVDGADVITQWCERGPNLDLLAPGDDVPTLGLGPAEVEPFSGTSFATPAVCGAVALMRQANPNLRVADLYSILASTSKANFDGDSERGDVTNLTYQRLDLRNAVAMAVARKPAGGAAAGEVAVAAYGNDVAYDPDGVLHVVYHDGTERNLKYVTRGTDGTLSAAQVVDTSGNDVGGQVSVAIDSHGRPGVAYFDGSAGDLRFAHFNGESWDVEIVDSRGSVGLYPSIVYDGGDHAVISYFRKSSGDLRVARQSDDAAATNGWDIEAVDLTDVVGRSTDITRNAKTGEIAVAYEDSTRGWLKIARYANGAWSTSVVDAYTLGVTHTSIAFDHDDQPAISYYDINRADLKYSNLTAAGWQIHRLASKGAQGLYTQLYFGKDGLANIVYYNRKSNLVMQLTGSGIGAWTPAQLESGGGRYIALAVDPTDGSATYSWFEPGPAKLHVADV